MPSSRPSILDPVTRPLASPDCDNRRGKPMTLRTRNTMLGALVAVVTCGCAGVVPTPREAASLRDPALADFYTRIDRYLDLRDQAFAQLPEIRRQQTAVNQILNQEAREGLARRLQQARATARQGDIFTSAVALTLRSRLDPEVRGVEATDTRATIRDDAPAAFTLRVNDRYPEGASLPTMPANVLAVLPVLRPGLEYRILNSHLILRDTQANIIVDYLPDIMCRSC